MRLGLSLLFALAVATPVLAQTGPSWNRRATSMGITAAGGGPAGSYDIDAGWRIDLEGTSLVGVALGVSVDLLLNSASQGTAVSNDSLSWDVPGSSTFCQTAADGDPCGTATINSAAAQLTCDAQTGTCATPPFTVSFASIALSSGDTVASSLTPAPGAAAEAFTDDDSGTLVFGSWNRRLRSALAQPTPGGPPGTFEIAVEWVMDFDAASTLSFNLGTQTDARQCDDGNPPICTGPDPSCCEEACNCPPLDILAGDVSGDDEFGLACIMSPGAPCGEAIIGGLTIELTCDPDTDTCSTPSFFSTITDVPPPPFGRMLVSLIPAPGALPELSTNDDSAIVEFPPAIPSVSRWGVVVLSVLLLTSAGLALQHLLAKAKRK